MEKACRVPGWAAPSVSTAFSPLFTQLHGVSVYMQAHTGTHIYGLPGVVPSGSLTPSPVWSVGPGLTLPVNTDTEKHAQPRRYTWQKRQVQNQKPTCACGGAPAVTSTCGNRLTQADPQAVHTNTHVETCSQRYTCAETHAPGETRRNRDMENTETYRQTYEAALWVAAVFPGPHAL